ncbi:MAG TPA: nuclear transport factor 2 family protein [Steroidobacteraceae bacterium]|nr:nuclear transport factor 2 family protein [Steroidobacteraceae bacterium]
MISNIDSVRRYLDSIAAGDTGAALAEHFTEDALQIELPNKLNPNGGRSDLATLLARAEQGKTVLTSQRYDIVSVVSEGERVAVEALWEGVLAIPLGALKPGDRLRAHFAMFFEFRDGRIALQRNYDCFEPF